MQRVLSCRARWLVCGLVAAAAALSGVRPAAAVEPLEPFVEALKRVRYHDAALDYLQLMETSPLLNDEQKRSLPLLEGSTLVDQARQEKDPEQKAKQLDAATAKLNAFVQANSSDPKVADATMSLGEVLVERARFILAKSTLPSQASNKEALTKEAHKLFEEAKVIFNQAATKFEADWRAFPTHIDQQKEPAQFAARERAMTNAIKAYLVAAGVDEELAKTFPAKSADAKKLYQSAIEKYEKIYENFRGKIAGLVARMAEARCLMEIDEPKRALGLLQDILSLPDEKAVKDLKTSALYLSQQCWNLDPTTQELSVLKGDEWLNHATGAEDQQGDWLAVRFYTAEAYYLLATNKFKDDANQKSRALNKAREHLNYIAKVRGNAYEGPARALLDKIMGDSPTEQGPPKNFADALRQAQEAQNEMSIRLGNAQKNPAEAAQENQLASEAGQRARDLYRLALELRTDETSIDDINKVRYSLCNLDYQAGNYYEAAVLGEFLARNYFQSAGAREGAIIALASYSRMMADTSMPPQFRDTDRRHMVSVAEYMASRWKGEAEADAALNALAVVIGSELNIPKALEYLGQISEKSPLRSDAEMKVGQFCYSAYAAALKKEADERPPQAEIDKLLADAQKLLESGLGGMRASVENGAAVTPDIIRGALLAANIYLNSNQPQKALTLLEDEYIGPLTLVDDQNAAIANIPDAPLQAYQLALQSYVGTKAYDKAQSMMEKLKQVTGDSPEGKARLTNILIRNGRMLEEQIKQLRDSGKPKEALEVSKAFELFLDQISKSSEGNSFASLDWVASTFYSLGAGNDSGKALSPDAKAYYEKSLAADKKLLERSQKEPGFAPSEDAVLSVRLRDAKCLRRLKKFQESVDELEKIVKERQLLEAQKEAAQAFMDWGAADKSAGGNPLYYKLAVAGARTDPATGKKSLWGWGQISSWAQSNFNDPKNRDEFFEARWQVSNCRVQQAQHPDTPPADKAALLNDAYKDIFITSRLKPNFGGPPWDAKFDALLKTIQKLQGKDPIGVKAFEQPADAVAN